MLKMNNISPVSYSIRIMLMAAIFYAITVIYIYNNNLLDIKKISNIKPYLSNRKFKYILQWTPKNSDPFRFMGHGISAFVKNKCQFTNCYVTDIRRFFSNLTDFDAIAFNGMDIEYLWVMPSDRSPKQKYIFGAMESADNFPVCNPIFDGFFNWTWTYRIDSNFRFGYITIFDLNGTVIGPSVNMKWPNQLDPISNELKKTLATKTKAGAWFVSHCSTKRKREDFVSSVQKELKKYHLNVDVFGACGKSKCPKKKNELCLKLIKDNYYFYFSFENSFSEDYVTEKLLTALNGYAIPVVFGAADYKR